MLIAIGAGGKWVHDNFETLFTADAISEDPPETEIGPPPNLAKAKSELELAFEDLASSIASDDITIRGNAMVAATERVLSQSDESDLQKRALGGWFLKEPNAFVANRFNQTIEKAINSPPRTSRDEALRQPYRAAKLALNICMQIRIPQRHPLGSSY